MLEIGSESVAEAKRQNFLSKENVWIRNIALTKLVYTVLLCLAELMVYSSSI